MCFTNEGKIKTSQQAKIKIIVSEQTWIKRTLEKCFSLRKKMIRDGRKDVAIHRVINIQI